MGYTTNFEGKLKIEPTLPQPAIKYINKFSGTRRMKRVFENNIHGIDGEFFVDGKGFAGQDNDDSVVNSNMPPSTQPGLWCQWVVSDCGNFLKWDESEKFYHYTEWLSYMINSFFAPNRFRLNGEISWQGEDPSDNGTIFVKNNIITVNGEIIIPIEPKQQKLIVG